MRKGGDPATKGKRASTLKEELGVNSDGGLRNAASAATPAQTRQDKHEVDRGDGSKVYDY